jgi:hypothetical protein
LGWESIEKNLVDISLKSFFYSSDAGLRSQSFNAESVKTGFAAQPFLTTLEDEIRPLGTPRDAEGMTVTRRGSERGDRPSFRIPPSASKDPADRQNGVFSIVQLDIRGNIKVHFLVIHPARIRKINLFYLEFPQSIQRPSRRFRDSCITLVRKETSAIS